MVVGDLMLDAYTIGKARRISPEAPVAVLKVENEEFRPGGAGNVALNLLSMGIDVVLLGRVGADPSGEKLLASLAKEGVDLNGVVAHEHYPTPLKNRIIADNQQIVRIDREEIATLPEMVEQTVIDRLPQLMEGVDLIAVSDYGKGFVTRTLMRALIACAQENGVQVIVDPKGVDFSKYRGCDLIKPNLSEVYAAANLTPECSLEKAAERVLEATQSKCLMVTRSEAGITLFFPGKKREDFPVKVQEVKDVTGAGDTVLAALTCAVANGLSYGEGAQLSNIAAGIAIERFGCARVNLSELARRLLSEDVENKVFDEEHLFALQEALKGRRYVLLALSSKEGMTTAVFQSLRKLALRQNRDLLVYVRETDPPEEFVEILASLHNVDYIIVNGNSLKHLCHLIHPEEVYALEVQGLVRLEEVASVL